MSEIEITSLIAVVIVVGIFFVVCKLLQGRKNEDDVFDFERDYEAAMDKPSYKEDKPDSEVVHIGSSSNNQNVFIESSAKHVFVCGTTGSGKTVALSNFLKAGADYDYPMLIVDGKGDTDDGSILHLVKTICAGRKIYVVNLNDAKGSDKYNPFKNTNTDVIKDMLINMTNWSEEHYKYNTERYLQRLLKLMELNEIALSLESLTNYLPTPSFSKLSRDLSNKKLITKEENVADIELSRISGEIAEAAAARFATIKESDLGQIFDESGVDIYSALEENAVILFILNPLLYPETSALIGKLIVIDSKKAVSNFFRSKKKRIFYILDEVNVYASTALLDLVNKSRSANITCVLAAQSLSDLDNVSEQFKEQIIENCNNYIVLRQNSPTNAEHWSNVFGTRQTLQATYQISSDDGETKSTNFGSLRKTREYLYHPDEIKQLPMGTAIFLSRDKIYHTKVKIKKPF